MSDIPQLIAPCPACGTRNSRAGKGAFSTYSCKNCGYFEMNSITHKKPPLRDALIEFLRGYGARLYDRTPDGWYMERYSIYAENTPVHESFDLDDIADEVNRDE